MSFPVPARETERIAALRSYHILDTPPEAAFGRVTRLAVRLFGVPVALVTLVDSERQWMKSCYGIDVRETTREVSFCTHTILTDEVMVIPDATQDPRFADNILVTGDLHVRFYAGAPLHTAEGHNLGALCLIDTKPCDFSAEDVAALSDLAALVVDEIELRSSARRLRDEHQERLLAEQEKREAEAALRGSEERCRDLINNANDLMYRTDAEGRFTFFNPAAMRITGYSAEELQNRHYLDLVYPEQRAHVARFYGRQFTRRTPDSYLEYAMISKDGRVIWFGQHVHLIIEDDEVMGFQAVAREITERKEAEDRLRLMESVVVNANDAVLITEAEPIGLPGPRILYANEAFTRTSGYSLEEILGQTPRILQGPETDREPRDKIRAALERWEPVEVELLNYRKDGSTFWVELSIVPVANESGWYTHWVSIQRDISERRAHEQAIRESEVRKTAILETALDCIITIDHLGRVQEWNPAAESTFGFSAEQARDLNFPDLFVAPEWREILGDGLLKYLETNEWGLRGQRLELAARRADGEEIAVELSLKHIPIAAPPQFTAYVRDITRRKQSEAALMAAKEEAERQRESAERANFAKSEFLSRMSHELRTPLNAILGFGQLLEMEMQAGGDEESVRQIMKAGRHLLGLINEVLEISRIESGQLSISSEPVSVDQVCSEVLDLMRPQASAFDITLHACESETSGVFVVADQQRLKQVMLNLVSNAIKYNHPGGDVWLRVEATDMQVRLAVADNGNGIAEENLERLWTPFDRLGAERTGVEGTGIGLALSLRLVEVMNGHLHVQSTLGQGSTFEIELPRASSPLQNVASDDPEDYAVDALHETPHSILYIEDNPSNLQLIERIMEARADITLLTAMHGRTGLELAREHRPDLILLDLHLPEISGSEVLQQLQENPDTAQIPVVIVSADATSQQIERLLNAGARHYLTKPFNVRELLRVLDEMLEPVS